MLDVVRETERSLEAVIVVGSWDIGLVVIGRFNGSNMGGVAFSGNVVGCCCAIIGHFVEGDIEGDLEGILVAVVGDVTRIGPVAVVGPEVGVFAVVVVAGAEVTVTTLFEGVLTGAPLLLLLLGILVGGEGAIIM